MQWLNQLFKFGQNLKPSDKMETSKKIIGFTDSVNECDCCGKSGLKGTFCVEIDGNEFYYGSTCAFKKHGFEKKECDKVLRDYNYKLDGCQRIAGKQLRREFGMDNFSEQQFDLRVKELMSL